MKITIETETEAEAEAVRQANIPERQTFESIDGFILIGVRRFPGGGLQTLDRHHNGAIPVLTGAAIATTLRLIFGHPMQGIAEAPVARGGGGNGRDPVYGE